MIVTQATLQPEQNQFIFCDDLASGKTGVITLLLWTVLRGSLARGQRE
jgi:hypothetical protein